MKLHTKSDFTALMHRFLDPLLPLYSEGGARLHLGDTGVPIAKDVFDQYFFSDKNAQTPQQKETPLP